MLIGSPIPFREAMQRLAVRAVMPTNLGSAELRGLSQAVLDRSFFSARTMMGGYLDEAKAQIEELINPRTVIEEGKPRTVGTDPATVRWRLKEMLRKLNYEPDPAKRGTIQDLSSDQRINLVVKTNAEMAQGFGYWRQGQDEAVLDEFPASELIRVEDRKAERDWGTRWLAAARAAQDQGALRAFGQTGRMVARKDSGVWQGLGDGAGGYDDTLGAPYPPFAFGSGMDVRDVDREEAVKLGVVEAGTKVAAQEGGFEMAD